MASLMIPPSQMSSSGFWFNPSPKPAVSVAWYLRDNDITYETAVARVDDAAVNIALAPKQNHAPGDQALKEEFA